MRPMRHLVIFARLPMLGGGKRRLAAEIGAVAAVRFQRVRVAVLMRRLGHDPRWSTWIAATPDRTGPWPAHVSVRGQGRGDLGQRMGRIMQDWPRGPVIIIGTDIPDVTAGDIAAAFCKLGGNDAVFGPAHDGGYWLVGLRRRPRVLDAFGDVRWSTSHALADTTRNLADVDIGHVRTLEDVDGAAALRRHPDWNRVVRPVR
jgi:uncharacterized protein